MWPFKKRVDALAPKIPKTSQPLAQDRDLLQELGSGIVEAAHDPAGKVLLYVEAEDGKISSDIFSQVSGAPVRYRYSPEWLKDIIWSYRESEPPSSRWATMAFVVSEGRFSVDLSYPDQLNPEEYLIDRRPRVVQAHFGEATVDYSTPDAAD